MFSKWMCVSIVFVFLFPAVGFSFDSHYDKWKGGNQNIDYEKQKVKSTNKLEKKNLEPINRYKKQGDRSINYEKQKVKSTNKLEKKNLEPINRYKKRQTIQKTGEMDPEDKKIDRENKNFKHEKRYKSW